MQSETRLVPVAIRIRQICNLSSDQDPLPRQGVLGKGEGTQVQSQWLDLFNGNIWLLKVADAANSLLKELSG